MESPTFIESSFQSLQNPYVLIFIGFLAVGIIMYIVKWLMPSEAKALASATPTFQTYQQVSQLAPLGCPQTPAYRLCDFYIASSSYSVFPSSDVFDYISDKILPMVIKAGPRLIELDIYSDDEKKPVVGLKNQQLGIDYAYNTVPFEACCVSIVNNAFNAISCPVSSDPFLLSLVFHTTNAQTLNACSAILKSVCGSRLLSYEYGFQRKNLAIEPICNLQNKLVLLSGNETKGTLMEELINLSWGTSNLLRLTYTQASQPHDQDELINYNRNHMTMVVPDLGNDLKNSSPQILLTYGCQLILMSYSSIDTMMAFYVGEFQENSCVLKPAPLRPLAEKKYTVPTVPDPSLSFQPMQKVSPIYNVIV